MPAATRQPGRSRLVLAITLSLFANVILLTALADVWGGALGALHRGVPEKASRELRLATRRSP